MRLPLERGFALVAALLAVVLIGALVAGGMFATTEETKVGATSLAREQALMEAESAIASTTSSSDLALPSTIGVAGVVSYEIRVSDRPVNVYVTRVDSTIYWVVADAAPDARRSGAHRRVGVLATLQRRSDGKTSIAPISERAWSELF